VTGFVFYRDEVTFMLANFAKLQSASTTLQGCIEQQTKSAKLANWNSEQQVFRQPDGKRYPFTF
jgi:hypothetical protein